MRVERIKSPDETIDPAFSEHISLVVCPFLGLNEDPGTSLGFAHEANHCHRLGKPVGIDLGHQSSYCLGENYPHCYVYGQSISQSEPDKTVETGASPFPQSPVDLELNNTRWVLNKPGLRIIGLLVMLLLIGIAAIVWWPPPGTSLQDFIVLGSPDTKDVTKVGDASLEKNSPVGSEETPFERTTDSAGEVAGLTKSPDKGELENQTDVTSGESSDAQEKQDKTAGAQLALTEKEGIPLEEKEAVEVDEAEIENPLADNEMVDPQTAAADERDPAGEEPAVVEDEGSAEQTPSRQTNDVAQTEQEVTEEIDDQEADVVSATETEITSSTPAEPVAAVPNPAVMTTFIGPIPNPAGLQGNSNSSPLLFLLTDPRDGADVLAMIPERQSVTVLGRDSSEQWLQVRLSSGVEGWVRARESGAPIVVSNLPLADDLAANEPVVPNPVSPTTSAEVTQSPTSENAGPVFGTAVINSGALNLRSGPGLEYEPIGVAYNGQQIFLLEPTGSQVWVLVRLSDGTQGYMNSNYLIQISWSE